VDPRTRKTHRIAHLLQALATALGGAVGIAVWLLAGGRPTDLHSPFTPGHWQPLAAAVAALALPGVIESIDRRAKRLRTRDQQRPRSAARNSGPVGGPR
jgi:hypothetical protein